MAGKHLHFKFAHRPTRLAMRHCYSGESQHRRHCCMKGGAGHMGLLWFLIIGLVAGWLAGMLVKGGGFGLIGDLVVGVLGAFLGGFLFGALGISGGGVIGSLLVATIGAVV